MLARLWPLAALLALALLIAPAPASAVESPDSGDPIVVISGDVTVDPGETVEGVFIVSGDAVIRGNVDGDVVVLSGDVLLSGTVDGDVFAASGLATLSRTAEVTGDVSYSDQRPLVSGDARVRGDVQKESWPDLGGSLPLLGGLIVWLAITISSLLLGLLLLLVAPRAADVLHERSRERIGPLIAIGIAIVIVLPVAAFLAAITLLGLPLAIGIGLAILPLGAVAYVVSAWVLGRRFVGPPRHRMIAFLAGLAMLRVAALVPILGLLVGLAAVIFGFGLLGAAIGAARNADSAEPAQIPGS
ncbi:MAG TPA: polymer-forming cytoskeletal protein [Solirubrobacterales bacterium]|nr:polymer-forming cytoskeletal protein [Solirubrobacterales bacterium]